jgi:hypothetical protein
LSSPPSPPAAPLTDAPTAALLSWARTRGIRTPLLTPASFGGLRGMAAASDIAAGAAAASVPHAAVLETTSVSRVCPHAGVCPPRAWAALPWWGRLALLLLRESSLGAASAFAPYVAVLPRAFDTPLHWSAPQRAALAAPRLAARVEAQRAELSAVHAALAAAAAADEPSCLAASVSLERFTWATEAVRSRTFSGPYEGSDAAERQQQLILIAGAWRALHAKSAMRVSAPAPAAPRSRTTPPSLAPGLVAIFLATGAGPVENALSGALAALAFIFIKDLLIQGLPNAPKRYVLCPLVDLCNHASGAVSDLAYEYFMNSFSLLTADFRVGEQVLISYGPQDNDELLQYYGFVEADNPHDAVPLGAAAAAGVAAAAPEARREALRATGALAELEQVRLLSVCVHFLVQMSAARPDVSCVCARSLR